MKALSIRNLKKTYADGTEALKGVDLEVDPGDFFALMGANGAGKTTVIGILTGLVTKTSGAASAFGKDIDRDPAGARALMGVVPQEMNFSVFEKVEDIIFNQAGYYGFKRGEVRDYLEDILRRLDLWTKRQTVSRNLSGGMKRRLMIARALIHQPRLLILDEPTAGVDVELRHSMWEFLQDLNSRGTTILLTTHYLEEVEQLCRNAAMIKEGRVFFHDRVRNLVNLVERETYLVHADSVPSFEGLKGYSPKRIDEHTFELDLNAGEDLVNVIQTIRRGGHHLRDIRPKGNRMEKLFLSVLRKGKAPPGWNLEKKPDIKKGDA